MEHRYQAKGILAPVNNMPVREGGIVRPHPLKAPWVTSSVTMKS